MNTRREPPCTCGHSDRRDHVLAMAVEARYLRTQADLRQSLADHARRSGRRFALASEVSSCS